MNEVFADSFYYIALLNPAGYRDRPDKDWSLTDCLSFEVMSERGVTTALTADRHFTQAGFQAILLSQNT